MNTDTQEEERRRGMTIDIGFAFLTESITLVDVPGHDRFVKNMVRGAAGIQMGLLVVAADDGVMPQTREHYHILRQLGIGHLLVALTKIDLVDADWVALVEEDIRALLAGSPVADSPILPVSSITGAGVPALKEALIEAAAGLPPRRDRGFFRLSIDRAFSIKGFGAVVTGTVLSGSYKPGDPLELVPGNLEAKVRSLQSHGIATDEVRIGDRAALNIGNLSIGALEKGEQLATPGFISTPTAFAAEITLLADAKPLPHKHPLRINVGTAEVMATIKFPDRQRMQPGDGGAAILDLAKPVPLVVGDRIVLRSYSPVSTIGGGVVLDVELPSKWRDQKKWLSQLAGATEPERLAILVASAGSRPMTLAQFARRLGLSVEVLDTRLPDAVGKHGRTGNPWVLTVDQFSRATAGILGAIQAHHHKEPFSPGLNREAIRQKTDGDEKFIEWLLKELQNQGQVEVQDEHWALAGFSVNLGQEENDLLDRLISTALEQGYEPETIEKWAKMLGTSESMTRTLVGLAEDRGSLVRISPKLMMHATHVQRLIEAVNGHFASRRELSVVDLKALTGTSRKLAVPLLEYLDRTGHTLRVGDKRVKPDG